MLVNLKKALDMKGISYKAYAAVLGISEKTAWNKINEETVMTLSEAVMTKKELFPEYDFDYLFASDKASGTETQEGGQGMIKENMEQPKEPIFYPDNSIAVFSDSYDTLQSIDFTLRRIEKQLIHMKTQSYTLDGFA